MSQLLPLRPLRRQSNDVSHSHFIHARRVKGLLLTRKRARGRFARQLAEEKAKRERGILTFKRAKKEAQ